ncbi:MAG TPA: 50S ribosomal protein L24 [Myxococcota bacterium]|nr:50S ribosomal protein L24 [Myxococcota bacterium]
MRIRKGDEVIIVAGKEKGKRGRVLRVVPEKGKVFIEKLNLVKRHQRPNQKYPQGGIVEKEAAIHLSNVMLIDPKDGKPTRMKVKQLGEGAKARASVRSNEQIGATIGGAK